MFKKVHIRLTLLCAGITAVIMIVMSLCYLYVSENGLYRNQFQSYQNDINTIKTNLEQHSVISMEWLSNKLNNADEKSTRNLLLEECKNAYLNTDNVSSFEKTSSDSSYISYHSEFEFVSASTGAKYFGSVINLGKYASSLEIIILSSLQSM